MFRNSIQKAAEVSKRCIHLGNTNKAATAKPAAEQSLLEVFIDDKRVLVEPGTTVLQVNLVFVDAESEILLCTRLHFHFYFYIIGCSFSWCGNTSILLPRTFGNCWQLQDVFGRS